MGIEKESEGERWVYRKEGGKGEERQREKARRREMGEGRDKRERWR